VHHHREGALLKLPVVAHCAGYTQQQEQQLQLNTDTRSVGRHATMLPLTTSSSTMSSRHGAGGPRSGRRGLVVTNVAVPAKPPAFREPKRSKVEIIKEKSDYLRHPLMQELVDEKTYISDEAVQLMKFHGSYMQDHREKRAFGSGKFYQFMMRTRQPAGLVTNQLYLVMDELADRVRRLCVVVGV
jgi:hypothetical protein